MTAYKNFLESKKKSIFDIGFLPETINNNCFPFQTHIITRALKRGRFAIFADCGLGKTLMQLEWAYRLQLKECQKVLILAPLAVVDQTKLEAQKFGVDISNIEITNYEQLSNLNPNDYCGIVLDESSILKNFQGKIRNQIIENFKGTKYKLCCTATPSPNDPMELGNHSEFLGVLTRNEMLAMYFVHDGGNTSKWRLKGHAVNQFYKFVSEWAIMLGKPSDIGFEDKGYILPELKFIEHEIVTNKKDNGLLFNDVSVTATTFNKELKNTMDARIAKVVEIVNASNEPFIVWCKHNDESKKLSKLINGAVEVAGSDKPEVKKKRLLGFAKNEFRVLVTKPKIAQYGLNYQHCNNQFFSALDFSFEGLYQAIRRSYRFGQNKQVNIHLNVTDTMMNVSHAIKSKQKAFNEMQYLMIKNQTNA